MRPKPVVLLILDGFGLRDGADDNAIHHANTPTFDRLAKSGPSAQLETSGEAVGLPKGQMGNSEVGHMNLGTGRIVYQDFTRISKAIDEGDFETNEVLVSACRQAKAQGGTLHILGLLSPGGVRKFKSWQALSKSHQWKCPAWNSNKLKLLATLPFEINPNWN